MRINKKAATCLLVLFAMLKADFSFTEYRLNKTVRVGALHEKLLKEGFNVKSVVQDDGVGFILWGSGGESKDPSAIISAHSVKPPMSDSEKRLESMRALAAKWQDVGITPQEKDGLLLMFIMEGLGMQ